MHRRLDEALADRARPRGARRPAAHRRSTTCAGCATSRSSRSTATCTSARRCAPCGAGRSSTSRASRPSRWPSGSGPTPAGATSPACCARSTTRPRVVERTASEHDTVGDEQRQYRAAEWSARNREAFLDGVRRRRSSRSTRRRCSRPTSPTRPSTRPSTRPATARPGCPSRWPPSPDSIDLRDRGTVTTTPSSRSTATSSTCSSAASTATRTPSSARTRTTAASPCASSSRSPPASSSSYGDTRARLEHEYDGIWAGVVADSEDVPDYRLEVTYDAGPIDRRRPLPLPADARRDRPAPDQRGPAREALGGARRPRPPLRHALRRRRSPAPRSPSGRRPRAACG